MSYCRVPGCRLAACVTPYCVEHTEKHDPSAVDTKRIADLEAALAEALDLIGDEVDPEQVRQLHALIPNKKT